MDHFQSNMNRILILFLSFWTISAQEITEVMADPNTLSDVDAEFVEIYDSSALPFQDTIFLQIQDKVYTIPPQKPLHYLLIGPQQLDLYLDSSQIYSPSSWTLTNSTELKILLYDKNKHLIDSVQIPKAVSGKSWQRFKSDWMISTTKSPWGDWASPLWSGNSTDLAQFQLLQKTCTKDGIQVELRKKSTESWEIQSQWFNPLNPLEIDSADLNWSGTELSLSTFLSLPWIHLRLTLKKGSPLYGQTWDTTFLCTGSLALKISEIYPSPTSTETEWMEIENTGQSSIDLAQVNWQNQYSQNSLCLENCEIPPHSRIIWLQDSLKFRQKYGPLRLKLLQGPSWPGLNNSGSTLRLVTKDSILIDSIEYGESKSTQSLCRESNEWKPCISSPGFAWNLHQTQTQIPLRLLSKSTQNLLVWNWAEQSLHFKFYDLAGNLFDSFDCHVQECLHPLTHFPIGKILLNIQSPAQNENTQLQVLP